MEVVFTGGNIASKWNDALIVEGIIRFIIGMVMNGWYSCSILKKYKWVMENIWRARPMRRGMPRFLRLDKLE